MSYINKMSFGQEYILDIHNCNKSKIADIKNIQMFIDDLIYRINMKSLGKIHYEYVSESQANEAGNPGIYGYSVCQFIITSSITLHFCEGFQTCYINLFSCKNFEEHIVKNLALKYFEGHVVNSKSVLRE